MDIARVGGNKHRAISLCHAHLILPQPERVTIQKDIFCLKYLARISIACGGNVYLGTLGSYEKQKWWLVLPVKLTENHWVTI